MSKEISLAQGRAYLAIPGPSVMPDAVLRAMHRESPNIYEGELIEMTSSIVADLRQVARTTQNVAMYIANGHGAWEAALANVAAPGAKVLVAATGRFGHGWAEMAEAMGIEAEIVDFGKSATIDPEAIRAALARDAGGRIVALLMSHVDTSSSVRNDVTAMRALLDETGHPALLMVDCIASLACDVFEMDAWGVDAMVAGSQKGLMVPPGMSFVFFSDKAEAVRKRLPRVSRYWDWSPRAHPQEYYQHWDGTAPTHHLFGLRAALDMILAEGIEAVWARHERLAHAIWAACEAWGEGGDLRLNIAERGLRSHAVTALRLNAPDGQRLRDWVSRQAGLTLGIGLGMAPPGDPAGAAYFRLGHMGHVNAQMVMGLLGGIEAGMVALGIPHGQGALGAAAAEIAGR